MVAVAVVVVIVYLSIYLSIYLSVCLSICKLENEAILLETSSGFELDNIKNEAIQRDFLNFWTWQRQKRSNSARLPHFLTLTTSKTQQFSETSSIFELDNVKNEAILRDWRDFLIFLSWQHQKRSNSARRPSKMESWVQSWWPRTNAFCNFATPSVYCACHEKIMMPGHTKCCTCHAKSSQQTWRSDAPKCNPSQKISARTS